MRAKYSDCEKPISIIRFVAMLKLVFNENRFHGGATRFVLSFYLHETFVNSLSRRVLTENDPAPILNLVRSVDTRACKPLPAYSNVFLSFLKEYAVDQGIAECDAAIHRYMRPANMILRPCVDHIVMSTRTVANVYEERI